MDCNRGFLLERDITSGEIKPFFIKVRKSDIVNDDGTPYTGGGGGGGPAPTINTDTIVKELCVGNYDVSQTSNVDMSHGGPSDIKLHEVITKTGSGGGPKRRMLYGTIGINSNINGMYSKENWLQMFSTVDGIAYFDISFPKGVLEHYVQPSVNITDMYGGIRSYTDVQLTFNTTDYIKKNQFDPMAIGILGRFLCRITTGYIVSPDKPGIYVYSRIDKGDGYNLTTDFGKYSSTITPMIKVFMISEHV